MTIALLFLIVASVGLCLYWCRRALRAEVAALSALAREREALELARQGTDLAQAMRVDLALCVETLEAIQKAGGPSGMVIVPTAAWRLH